MSSAIRLITVALAASSLRKASWSNLAIWLWPARRRVLTVVVAAAVATSDPQETPSFSSTVCNSRAASSTPTAPTSIVVPPIAVMLTPTFAAPPGRLNDRRTWSTGTGASGDMRSTVPSKYRSSMMSPTRRIRGASGVGSGNESGQFMASFPAWCRDRPGVFGGRICSSRVCLAVVPPSSTAYPSRDMA